MSELRKIPEQELKDILDKHGKWLRNEGFENPKLSKFLNYSYWISENGKIASAINPCLSIRKIPKILKKRVSINGYQIINFKRKNYLLHRILANEFIGDITNKIVHHKDNNKLNNKISNLQIVDYKTNNANGFLTRKEMYGAFINQCYEAFKAGKLEVQK